jgi:hypothetical protein
MLPGIGFSLFSVPMEEELRKPRGVLAAVPRARGRPPRVVASAVLSQRLTQKRNRKVSLPLTYRSVF